MLSVDNILRELNYAFSNTGNILDFLEEANYILENI